MQIGIDVGATKIESVILEDNGEESHRSRVDCPRDYLKIIYIGLYRQLYMKFLQFLSKYLIFQQVLMILLNQL